MFMILMLIIMLLQLKKGVNKYLIVDSTDENKELLKKYDNVLDGIRSKIKEVSNDEYD